MIRQEIIKLVEEALKATNLESPVIKVENPESLAYGDYATNVAFQIAKAIKMTPARIAENLRAALLHLGENLFEKIEIAGPGFINFFISKNYLQEQIGEILKQGQSFGKLRIGYGRKVNIESVSANPTGSLHVGNGRNAFAGDVLANVLEKAGFRVTREYFVNDAKNSNQIKELGKTALGKGTTYLTENLKSQILKLKTKIQISKLDESEAGHQLAQIVQKDNVDFLGEKLRVRFDKQVFEEKDLYRKNKIRKILEWLKKNGLVYEKDGALWIKTSQFGDDKDWVVVRETGEPTYLLSDVAYHKNKFDRGFNTIINIWGADHQAHVAKMKAVAKILGFKGDFAVLVLQLVTLKGGEKMSKREGNIVLLEDLVDEIGPDVCRFFYLQKSLDTHMEMDLDLAKEQSAKNPVFYIQYAYARICSILHKASKYKIRNIPISSRIFDRVGTKYKILNHSSELNLIKQLIRLPEVVEDTARDCQVQRLPQYAMDLAASFHQFYRDCQVISEDKNLSEARLALISAAKIIFKNTLSLMGIDSPEKM